MIYKTGKVYRIICLSEPSIQYIGSTFNVLRHRWQEHKAMYKRGNKKISIFSYFDKYGIDNFKIVLIKEYQVVDRAHLRAYEQLCINRIKCVNKNNPFSIKYLQQKTHSKEYRLKNKEKISSQKKEYRLKNKDKLNSYKKEYYLKNKAKSI